MTWTTRGSVIYRDGQLAAVAVSASIAAELAGPVPAAPPTAPKRPGEVLDLANWKLQLPIAQPDGSGILEVIQPALSQMADLPFCHVIADGRGVAFRAPTDGATTSGSKYPRSELREMKGADKAAWSTTQGGHHMEVIQAITALPRGKRHVVAGQIHDASDDVLMIRLEDERLFVEVSGKETALIDNDYALGDRFGIHLWAGGGRIKVFIDGASSPVLSVASAATGCYFKAGCYTQSNADTERAAGHVAGPDNYGEVVIYGLRVWHT